MTDWVRRVDEAFSVCPLVAILRGIAPAGAPAIGEALVEAGITLIEVPLNSPDPFDSIAILAKRLKGRAMVGAGTVLSVDQVLRVAAAGGTLIVSPNVDVAVISAGVAAGLVTLPGYFTVTEAFAALAAGAAGLKLFPADALPPAMLAAQRAVIPKNTRILAVGGIAPDTMAPWHAAGANGFGLGSGLFRPGKTAMEIASDAGRYVTAMSVLR